MGIFDFLTGGGSKAPAAPDPYKVAGAEWQFGNLDTYNPAGGGVRYGYTDASGNFVQGTPPKGQQGAVQYDESDHEAALRGVMQPGSINLARDILGAGIPQRVDAPRLDTRGAAIPNLPGLGGVTLDQAPLRARGRGNVAQDVFDRGMSLLRPEMERGNDRLLTNLQARGMPVGADGFNEAYGAQTQQNNDAVSRLALDANITAGQEQSREFELDRAGRGFDRETDLAQHGVNRDVAGFGMDRARSLFDMTWANRRGTNDAAMSQYGMDGGQRANALSELMALFGGSYQPSSQNPQAPSGGSNIGDYIGDQYEARLGEYQQDRSDRQATWGTIGSLAGSFLLCDQDLKDVILPVDPEAALEALQAIPVSFFLYTDEAGELVAEDLEHRPMHLGPMAQDFHRVTGLGDGHTIPAVDAVGLLMAALQGAGRKIDALAGRIEDLEARLFAEAEARAA